MLKQVQHDKKSPYLKESGFADGGSRKYPHPNPLPRRGNTSKHLPLQKLVQHDRIYPHLTLSLGEGTHQAFTPAETSSA